MIREPDLYSVLGVSADAEDVVIQGAYRALIRKYHPDQYRGEPAEGERRARALNAAYAILGDPEARARYDRERRAASAAGYAAASAGVPPRRRRTAGSLRAAYLWTAAALIVLLALGLTLLPTSWDGSPVAPPAVPATPTNAAASTKAPAARPHGSPRVRQGHGGASAAGPTAPPTLDEIVSNAAAAADGHRLGHAFYRDLEASASQDDALYLQGVEAEQNGRCEVVAAKVFELSDIADRRIVKVSGVEILPPPDATLKAHILTLKALEHRCKAAGAAFR
jgi:curved DNA-binding protein CbpA